MNKPVVMVDVVEPNVDAMEKVDLQVESTPGVYTVDVIEYTYVGRSIVYFCFAYIHKLQTPALDMINDVSFYLTRIVDTCCEMFRPLKCMCIYFQNFK